MAAASFHCKMYSYTYHQNFNYLNFLYCVSSHIPVKKKDKAGVWKSVYIQVPRYSENTE